MRDAPLYRWGPLGQDPDGAAERGSGVAQLGRQAHLGIATFVGPKASRQWLRSVPSRAAATPAARINRWASVRSSSRTAATAPIKMQRTPGLSRSARLPRPAPPRKWAPVAPMKQPQVTSCPRRADMTRQVGTCCPYLVTSLDLAEHGVLPSTITQRMRSTRHRFGRRAVLPVTSGRSRGADGASVPFCHPTGLPCGVGSQQVPVPPTALSPPDPHWEPPKISAKINFLPRNAIVSMARWRLWPDSDDRSTGHHATRIGGTRTSTDGSTGLRHEPTHSTGRSTGATQPFH